MTEPAEQEPRDTRDHYDRLLALLHDAAFVLENGGLAAVNPAGIALVGARDAADAGRAVGQLGALAREVGLVGTEATLLRLDGSVCDVVARVAPTRYAGRPARLLVVTDVTELRRLTRRLALTGSRLSAAFTAAPIAMAVVTAQGVVEEANPAFAELVAASAAEVAGRPAADYLHPADLPVATAAFHRLHRGRTSTTSGELRALATDGTVRWVLGSASRSPDGSTYVVQLVDITSRKAAEDRLAHQALHDALTGLPNRTLFLDRLQVALAGLSREPGRVAVLFLDLDGFKAVNDTLGHRRGDELLVEVSRRLREAVRASDTLARFGGDEFALLAPDIGDPGQADEVAARLAAAIRPPVRLGTDELTVTASIGVAVTNGGTDGDELLRRADIAMYQAKARTDADWLRYRG